MAAEAATHEQVVRRLAPVHRPRLSQEFAQARLAYPPARLTLVGLKEERVLEIWAPLGRGWTRVRSYPIQAASGTRGPKRREGDLQVPEGLYRLTHFNPNSSYHLSIRVDYPNADDRAAAVRERRTGLGGDIYIHGRAVSIGCLALGDPAIEELYVLLADVGLRHTRLILAPSKEPQAAPDDPRWVAELYDRIRAELQQLHGSR